MLPGFQLAIQRNALRIASWKRTRRSNHNLKQINMSSTHQLCAFYVDNLSIGIDVEVVQEVLQPQHVTRVPLTDPSVAGLVNLRGQIVTAIDLRTCLNRPSDEHKLMLSLIIRHESALVCFLVDGIGEVTDVDDSAFTPSPESLDPITSQLIGGAYRLPDGLLLKLDPSKVVQHVTELHKPTT